MQGYARWSKAAICRYLIAALFICGFVGSNTCRAALVVETHDLLDFEYQQVGANEEEAVRLACIRAVQATVGRILFSDYALHGRDLLDIYIQKNWAQFTASSYVLERRAERDGFGVRVRVQTWPEKLHRDLREKKFLYLPPVSPYHYVFLAETVDGQIVPDLGGRAAVNSTLAGEGFKVYEEGIESPVNNSEVTADPAFLAAARIAAIKLGADVIITGRAATRTVSRDAIYYDEINSYETQVHLEMIKVDDGTVIGEVTYTDRASDTDPKAALRTAVETAAIAATEELALKTRGWWSCAQLENPKFSLMFTDVTPEEFQVLARYLQSKLSFGTKVYKKSWFGNVGILNIDTDRAWAAVERAIIDFAQFDLRVTDRQGKRITVSAKH